MAASIFIPACISRLDGQNNQLERCEHVIEALASGIYLGLLMLFMIPETIDDFVDVWSSKIKERLTINTMALSSLCSGVFLVAIVEYIAANASCCVGESRSQAPVAVNTNGSVYSLLRNILHYSGIIYANSESETRPLLPNSLESGSTGHAENSVNDCQVCNICQDCKTREKQNEVKIHYCD